MALNTGERIQQGKVVDTDGRQVFVQGVADTLSDSGATSAAPAANTNICGQGITPPAGVYDVEIVTFQVGTPDANRNNAALRVNGVTVTNLLTTATPTTQRFRRITTDGSSPILVRTGTTVGGAGAVYVGSITLLRVA